MFSENIVENNYVFSNKKSKFDWSNYDGIRTEVTEVNFEEFEKKDISKKWNNLITKLYNEVVFEKIEDSVSNLLYNSIISTNYININKFR